MFIMIGDTWLDIEAGRKLNIPTILIELYKITSNDARDGIGNRLKHINAGATFYAKNFKDVGNIIDSPQSLLLSIEGVFHLPQINSYQSIKIRTEDKVFIRSLARQQQGECDSYIQTDKYFQISNSGRSQDYLKKLAKGVENYLNHVISYSIISWDIISYVSDKLTTKPPNKMKEIFDTINTSIKKEQLFYWSKNVQGSLRDRKTRRERKDFIFNNIFLYENINIQNKNIIIVDDQITTAATADILIDKLKHRGANYILFIGLFSLISNVESLKKCPRCGKNLVIKIKRNDGNKFFSCVLPKYGGNGCGYTENINE